MDTEERLKENVGCIAKHVLDYPVSSDGTTIIELITKYRMGTLREVVTCGDCQHGTEETEGVIAGYINCPCQRCGELHRKDWFCADGIRKTQEKQAKQNEGGDAY